MNNAYLRSHVLLKERDMVVESIHQLATKTIHENLPALIGASIVLRRIHQIRHPLCRKKNGVIRHDP